MQCYLNESYIESILLGAHKSIKSILPKHVMKLFGQGDLGIEPLKLRRDEK